MDFTTSTRFQFLLAFYLFHAILSTSHDMETKTMDSKVMLQTNLSNPSAMTDSFFASLESNLKQPSCPFPYDLFQQRKPLVLKKKIQIGNVRDESVRFMAFVHENTHEAKCPDAIVKTFSLCNDNSCRIIAAVLSHDDGSHVGIEDIALLRDFIHRRLVVSSNAFTNDLTVIGATAFDDDCQPVLSPPIVLCTPTTCNLWDFRFPQAIFSTETINFFFHALPGSPDAYADRLADLIDHWPQTMYCTKDALRPKLALHPSIPDDFFDHWLNVLFERSAHSKDKNDWYAKDDRGVIYPPGGELPEGQRAKRVNRFR